MCEAWKIINVVMFREVTYYTCTAIMFLFGFKMLWEAWKIINVVMFREVTYYICTAIMFLFGFKMLWEAWKMDENEAEEVCTHLH